MPKQKKRSNTLAQSEALNAMEERKYLTPDQIRQETQEEEEFGHQIWGHNNDNYEREMAEDENQDAEEEYETQDIKSLAKREKKYRGNKKAQAERDSKKNAIKELLKVIMNSTS